MALRLKSNAAMNLRRFDDYEKRGFDIRRMSRFVLAENVRLFRLSL